MANALTRKQVRAITDAAGDRNVVEFVFESVPQKKRVIGPKIKLVEARELSKDETQAHARLIRQFRKGRIDAKLVPIK